MKTTTSINNPDFSYVDFSDESYDPLLYAEQAKQNYTPVDTVNILKQTGKGKINETKMLPMTLYTDSFTAEQVVLLLDMIRFCMERSAECKSDDASEFSFNVHIKNRSRSDFVVSIGDESQEPIAYTKDVYIGH